MALYDDKTSHETLLLCQSLEIYEPRNFAFECLSLFRFACGFMVYLLTEGKAASRRHIKSMQFPRNVLVAFRVLTFSPAQAGPKLPILRGNQHPIIAAVMRTEIDITPAPAPQLEEGN